ncbi:hypothetical protein B1813_17160 [Saccharomonospora piscinae]|uniref:DUF4281 domain-containing protein n=1 Tax=Saccharomonospora piscinae TaxID=687388 RepID=A0A1V8ZZK1_SACPI|nr:ABA4-like family protein [Saccharomonospora piscinae]OQO90173.1 hypothetical protein B1813_17160 [Saccharomonospora piscinae]TLW89582.1 DUF4281 domain-containing protein [Saccharomonospora piscinae]
MTTWLFDITFLLAVPFWALMIVAPGWSWTGRLLRSPWSATAPLAVYVLLAVPEFGRLWEVVSRPDLETLRAFLATPEGAAAIWAHLIAFDLFVGRWIHHDARARGVPHLLVAPVLVLTILLSPFGLLAYLLIRVVKAESPGSKLADRELQQ